MIQFFSPKNEKRRLIKIFEGIERRNGIPPKYYQELAKPIYKDLWHFDVSEFTTDIEPLELVLVDPTEVNKVTGREWKAWSNRRNNLGKIKSGDWDKTLPTNLPKTKLYPREFIEHNQHKGFVSHFEYGVSWEETERYGELLSNCQTDSEARLLRDNLKEFDRLYQDIETNGYKSQIDLLKKKQSYLDTRVGEILIDIGRNGELLFVDGRHRLSIAKILGLDKIPVCVLVRHRAWVNS